MRTRMKRMIARCTCDGATKQKNSAIICNLCQVALGGDLKSLYSLTTDFEIHRNGASPFFYRADAKG